MVLPASCPAWTSPAMHMRLLTSVFALSSNTVSAQNNNEKIHANLNWIMDAWTLFVLCHPLLHLSIFVCILIRLTFPFFISLVCHGCQSQESTSSNKMLRCEGCP